MPSNAGLNLTPEEINRPFLDPIWAAKFPPVLTIEMSAELLVVPVETLRSWRSRGLLDSCSRCVGKSLRFVRDRLIVWFFNDRAPLGGAENIEE